MFLTLVSCNGNGNSISVPVVASWKQDIPNTDTFGGWEIYVSNSESGTYSLFKKLSFTEVSDMYSYMGFISATEGEVTVKWFKAVAYDKDGSKSEFSNKSRFMVRP
jgi:hypothetical protein